MVLRQAFILNVTIASPSDMQPTRNAIFEHIDSFNRTYADDLGFILRQNSWEHAVGASGRYPQDELNHQIVSRADVMVAMFKDKFGSTTTAGYGSGTQEEIELFFSKGGRPAVYFPADLNNRSGSSQLDRVRKYQQELYGREFFVSNYVPAPADMVDTDMLMKAMEAIQLQARTLVRQSTAPAEEKKTIQATLGKLTKKTPTPKPKQTGTDASESGYPRKDSGGSWSEIIGPKSGIIGRDVTVPKSPGSSQSVYRSAKTGSFVSKSAKASLTGNEALESSIDRQLDSKKRGQGKVAWTPSQRPSDDPVMKQFERAFAGEEPVFIRSDGSTETYMKVSFETGKLKVTLDYASGVWHIRNRGDYNLHIDHVDILLKRNSDSSISKKIGILREINETLESLTTLPIEIPSGVQRRDAMRVEFQIYYRNPSGGLFKERIPVKPLQVN